MRPLYSSQPPSEIKCADDYAKASATGTTINHFHEKLLKVRAELHTVVYSRCLLCYQYLCHHERSTDLKLPQLKDMMKTKSGRAVAQERHQFMETFLVQFAKECNGDA